MRNLTTIQATQCQCLPRSATSGGSTAPNHESIASLAINPDEDSIYSISECHFPDGDGISLSIFKSSRQPSPSFVYQTERIANFQSSLPVLEGWPEGRSQVVDFEFLPESESLCVVLAGGEIVLVNVGIWDDSGDNGDEVGPFVETILSWAESRTGFLHVVMHLSESRSCWSCGLWYKSRSMELG